MSTLLAAAMLAIVTQNQVALRAAPRDSATQQAALWQGELLDVRDVRGDYLLVYDLKLERQGYIRASQVRITTLQPQEAPELLAVMRFLRETPGSEALGISYAAAYLKAIAASALTAEPLDALGEMADRLAWRASTVQSKNVQATISAHLEVVSQLGVTMQGFEREGSVQICYDGEVFKKVLSMPSANAAERARAALGLTRHECVDPNMGPIERYEFDQWRADVLDRVPTDELIQGLKSRLLIRRAGVLASLAFWQQRRGLNSQLAAERSIEDLAGVDKGALDDDGLREYADAAVRVGASRLAALKTPSRGGKLVVHSSMGGAPGETCVALFYADKQQGEPLIRRCTYGTVWNSSVSSNADGTALTLAVQPLATWRELWVFRNSSEGWTVSVLPPNLEGPGLGYIESAGWDPGTRRLLVCREAFVSDHLVRRFELVRLDTLATVHQSTTPEYLTNFARFQDPIWRSNTVALR